jgi:hypothetical protein
MPLLSGWVNIKQIPATPTGIAAAAVHDDAAAVVFVRRKSAGDALGGIKSLR